MPKIIITGNKRYVNNLAKHLKKEHPSTKKRLKVVNKRRCKRNEKD